MNPLTTASGPLSNPQPGSPGARQKLNERLAALVGVLTQERAALERLLFALMQCALLSEAKEHRFLARASDEVQDVEEELGMIETARAMLVDDIAELAGIPADSPLSVILGTAEGRIEAALSSLHAELIRLSTEVTTLSKREGKAIAARLETITGALQKAHTGIGDAYDRWGDAAAQSVAPTQFDHQA